MYGRPQKGKVVGNEIVVEDLPVPGRYDLKIETASGGVVAGWDATVPQSDYEGDPPLEEASRRKILKKLGDPDFSSFADRMVVLDIQGNIQNAAVLVMKLRMRPFVGGNYKPGEWVWRVERWQWENPDEHTWVPFRKRPFYALIRERLRREQYRAKRVIFSRQLGGITLTQGRKRISLGKVKVPRPTAGACAVNPDGSRIRPMVLKGLDKGRQPSTPQTNGAEHSKQGGAG
jgi:hypothetical protein